SLVYRAITGNGPGGWNTGGLFAMWIISLSVGQALFNRELRILARGGLAALGLGTLGLNIVTTQNWVSGWGPGLLAVLVLCFMHSRRTFAVALIILGLGVASQWDSFMNGSEKEGRVQGSRTLHRDHDDNRGEIWSQTFEITRDNYLIGTGMA